MTRSAEARARQAARRAARARRRDVHGIVLLDKPLGLTSNQALQAVRELLRAAKGGHAGALDPAATGLLPLCFGEATKLAGTLLGGRKGYLTECRLGVTTDTGDTEGEVLTRSPVPELDGRMLEAALQGLRGRIVQTPPAYSAIKQGGERLYAKARRGEAVQAVPREVDVHRLELLAHQGDRLTLDVECGSGTYIRSLVADLGARLGCGAHVTALRRTWVEPFHDPAMLTLEDLRRAAAQGDAALLACVLPVTAGLVDLPGLHLDPAQTEAVALGRQIGLPAPHPVGRCAAFGADGALLAVLDVGTDGKITIVRGFHLPPPAGFAPGAAAALVETPPRSVE